MVGGSVYPKHWRQPFFGNNNISRLQVMLYTQGTKNYTKSLSKTITTTPKMTISHCLVFTSIGIFMRLIIMNCV